METFYWIIGREADPIAWWQMSVRAAIIFVWAVFLYRVLPRRAFGSNAAADIVLVVILGSTLSRGLTGNAPLLPVLAATIVLSLLYVLLSFLSRESELVSHVTKGRSLQLIRDGRIDHRAMRLAQLGEHDLQENLRTHGLTDVSQVAEAYLERNGQVSVIKKN